MTFENAIQEASRKLGLSDHTKQISRSCAYTYAEKIAIANSNLEKGGKIPVKASYMFLDRFDFCFFQLGKECAYSISGVCYGNDVLKLPDAINKARCLCRLTEEYMEYGEENETNN